jgi:zinc D-Ala-D-Ala carboxypeptidase
LIQHTIKTEEAAESEKFAEAVARWQKENRLSANGIVDQNTLAAFVKFWQSRRLGSSQNASEFDLLTAPPSDFYDPSREAELRKLERETYNAYKRMVAAAAKDLNLKFKDGALAADEKFLKIISAYRSRAYQDALRRKEPNAGRAGLAVNSPHFTGRALDIYVGGEPVTTKDENRAVQIETPAYKWLVKNAEKFGFRPYFYEPWHWEYAPNK